jgi:hypothetical protein
MKPWAGRLAWLESAFVAKFPAFPLFFFFERIRNGGVGFLQDAAVLDVTA